MKNPYLEPKPKFPMCFSAAASFGASAIIGSVGAVGLSKASTPSQRVLGLIPAGFALQQFSEGFVWLALRSPAGAETPWLTFASNSFLFFAWIIWPILIPYSFQRLEPYPLRKKILQWITVLGVAIAAVLSYVIFAKGVTASISSHHIIYDWENKQALLNPYGIFYVIPTVISCFISSVKRVWYLGVINLASYLFAQIAFKGAVLSIFCFFAAASSFLIMIILIEMQKKPVQQEPQLT